MISLLIISFGRYQEVLETFACVNKYHGNKIELLFLDNNPARELETALSSILENNSSILFSYFHTGENLGVAEGRNFLIEKAQGDILITLDDDVEIEDITLLIQKVTDYMANNAKIGALAFNIKNYFTRKTLSHEIPHGNKKLDFSPIPETLYQKMVQDEFSDLIEALWQERGTLTKAATRLFIHRNTLQYRIDRFGQLTGLALKNMDDLTLCHFLLMQQEY